MVLTQQHSLPELFRRLSIALQDAAAITMEIADVHGQADTERRSATAEAAAGSSPLDPPVRGPRQREIVQLAGMSAAEGMRNGDIAKAIDYDEPNVWNTLKVLQKAGIVEAVPMAGPQRWRLTLPYRVETPGLEAFRSAAAGYPEELRDHLKRLGEWAEKVAASGLGRLTTSQGPATILRVALPNDYSLVIVNVPHSLQVFPSVFAKRAPNGLRRLEALVGPLRQGQAIPVEQVGAEVLDVLTAAYEEAAAPTA